MLSSTLRNFAGIRRLKFRFVCSMLFDSLKESDSELYQLIKNEYCRQKEGLDMIASENFTSRAVYECLGSCLTNKYSEGRPYQRYYGGNEFIDKIEALCEQRALEAFGLDKEVWGVNVQPYSGSPANLAVYTALLSPHDRIMGLNLPDGGHLTHGFHTLKKKVSATSIFWESMPYHLDPITEMIDYDRLQKSVVDFKPKLIISGFSCYSRHLDFSRFRQIADSVGAVLMADIAHIAGLVAANVYPSPFIHCDVVTTTTHKTLRGPRSGMIFYRHKIKNWCNGEKDVKAQINWGVFPALQGGPHNNVIAAVATSLLQVNTEEFRQYAIQIVKNSKTLALQLKKFGHRIATGDTDNHIVLLNLTHLGLHGAIAEGFLELIGISANKNACVGDKSVLKPSGIRIGTAALTSRGFKESQMEEVATILHDLFILASDFNRTHPEKVFTSILSIKEALNLPNSESFLERLDNLKSSVIELAKKFPIPSDILFE